MSTEHKWLPNWYATRLHAYAGTFGPPNARKSECGAWVHQKPPHPWAERQLAIGVPRCKKCEKKIAQKCAPFLPT